jgi:hypothetical protein
MKPFPYTTDPTQIPTKKVTKVAPMEGESEILYACPDACWAEHLEAWRKERRGGNKSAPSPMPFKHCMFESPLDYACVPYGCTDPALIRQAHENDVRALLNGWDRDLNKEKLDKIVTATVEARLAGQDIGAAPFLACIYANL